MLRLVTSNNVEVFRHLGSTPFRRIALEHKVETGAAELFALVKKTTPDLVLVDAHLEGGESGFQLCRRIKEDPALARTHVILLLSKIITRPELDGIETSRCDDVLALPIASEDFYHHLAQVTGLPLRRTPRVGIDLSIVIEGRVEQARGTIMNASQKGLGVRLPRLIEPGQEITARIRHGATQCDLSGRVAWCRVADAEPGYIAGIELTEDIPIRTRLLLEQLSLFEVMQSSGDDELGGAVIVVVQGDITEAVDLGPLAMRLRNEQRIVFDMAGVRYVSSAGVKAWSDIISTLVGKEYAFRHCSIAFSSQAAMVPMVVGTGQVLSLEAPYHCTTCDRDDLRLLETRALLREGGNVTPPTLRCVSCGGELEFDDLPNRYFAFLRQPATQPPGRTP
jgi:CheY-like chemotaxis protein